MGADPVIYCLEQVTDYSQFERLCHDLMAQAGYPKLEPIGGTKDRGRDAIHSDTTTGTQAVFAYSVREDWRPKLEDDAAKVKKHGHACTRLVFLCTAAFTAGERDAAVKYIRDTYGWELELYGLERLAVMLRSTHRETLARHPQIFCPPFFPVAGGLSIERHPDHVLIDHVDADGALAHWITRRLTLAGYNVWCRGLAPMAGASANDTIRSLLRARTFKYVGILSPAALASPDSNARRAIAHAMSPATDRPMVLPVRARAYDADLVDPDTRRLDVAACDTSWATGLKAIMDVLEAEHCPRAAGGGRDLALRSYFPANVVLPEAEPLASNLFPVLAVPLAIKRFTAKRSIPAQKGPHAERWAFHAVSDTEMLAFHAPPPDMFAEFGVRSEGGTVWSGKRELDGVKTEDLLTELVKKTMYAECLRRGLKRCEQTGMIYFPVGLLKHEHLYFRQLDGQKTHFTVTGEVTHTKASGKFRYYVSPVFVPKTRPSGGYDLIIRIRVRITDLQGNTFPGHGGNARRKKVCRSWWNKAWLARTMGVMQFLAGDAERISIGDGAADRLEVASFPRTWMAPLRINEDALGSDEAEEEWPDEQADDDEDGGDDDDE